MKTAYRLTMLIATMFFASSAHAQIVIKPGVPAPGASKTELTLDVAQTLKLAEMELITGQKRSMVINSLASKPDTNGNVTVNQTFDSFKDETTLPGGVTLKYDSKDGPEPQGTVADFLTDVLDVMAKSKTTLVYDKNHKVISVDITADGLDDLAEPGKSLLQADLDPQAIKDRVNSEFAKFHSEPAKPGDTWKKNTTTELGQGAKFTHATESTYVGVEDVNGKKLHKVTIAYSDVEFSQAAPAPGAPSVTKSDLELVDGGSTYYYDASTNQVVSSQFKLHVKGEITLSVQDMEISAELDISISTVSKTR